MLERIFNPLGMDDIAFTMTESMQARRALLQVWLSPSFPVGAFAYSHGLEKVVENGWIVDRSSLQAWIADLIGQGSLRNDLVLLRRSLDERGRTGAAP